MSYVGGSLADTPHRGKKAAQGDSRALAYRLRARIRLLAPTARERACGLVPVAHAVDHPEITVRCDEHTGQRRASWSGLLSCGHVWTCPVCSAKLRSERAERIALAVESMGGRWQLVTFTIAHHAGMPLKDLLPGMMRAIRRMKQGGAVQRLWGSKVTASVRTTEILHGEEHGWHPHIHMLVRTDEWDWQDKLTLLRRWQACVERELGAACVPNDTRGVWWSDPFEGSVSSNRSLYCAKLGLEAAGVGKTGKRGNLTPWGIAEKAAEEDGRNEWTWGPYQRLWREFSAATKGRRMIEMDDRMASAADKAREARAMAALEATAADARTTQDCTCGLRDAEGPHKEDCHAYEAKEHRGCVRIPVHRDQVRALRMLENAGRHWVFASVLSAAEERGTRGVREWLDWASAQIVPRIVNGADSGGRAATTSPGPVYRNAS